MGFETSAFLIRGARQLLTLHGTPGPRRGPDLKELGIIHDGAVLVRDGVVCQVGTARRVENLAEARDAVEVSAAGRVVMPGFIDSHTHLAFPPPYAPPDDLELAARRIRTSSTKRLTARLRIELEAMVRHGTTTAEIKTCGGLDEAVDTKQLRVVAGLRNNPMDAISTFHLRLPEDGGALDETVREAAVRACESFLLKIARRRLARFASVDWSGDEARRMVARRLLRAAAAAGLAAKVQLSCGGSTGDMPLLNDCKVAAVDHVERMAPNDIRALEAFPGVAAVLPSDGFCASETASNLRALVDGGAAIALGSDYHPKYGRGLNMQTVIAMACLQGGLTPEEAISAATVNAAQALGCAGEAGSLEVGKQADLLILNAADHRDLGRQLGTNLVHLTMKRGAFIYKEGEVMRLTADDLRPRRRAES